MSRLDEAVEQETRIISMLRRAVEHEQERLAWSLEDMGEKLGIPAAGVRVLMAQSWSLETAVRVADALGITFGFKAVMGTEYYLVSRRDKECFELGIGAWADLDTAHFSAFSDKMGLSGMLKSELFNVYVRKLWSQVSWSGQEEKEEYLRDIGTRIYEWCESKNWDVVLVNDAIGDLLELVGYRLIDTRYTDERSKSQIGKVMDSVGRWPIEEKPR